MKRHTQRLFGLSFCFKVRLYLSLNYLAAVATYGLFRVLILGQNESLPQSLTDSQHAVLRSDVHYRKSQRLKKLEDVMLQCIFAQEVTEITA